MTALWTLLQFAAGLVILWESIVRLNAMTPATRISVSISWIALGASSAVAGLPSPSARSTPSSRRISPSASRLVPLMVPSMARA